MKERPILMTPENAQKCHEGTKTKTRRIINPQPKVVHGWGGCYLQTNQIFRDGRIGLECPHGSAGDRLWVRENGWERPARTSQMMRDGADTWEPFYFDALLDQGEAEELKGYGFKRRPSIHMPRKYCRTVLEITSIKVERLQEITEEDVIAEGVNRIAHGRNGYYYSAFRDVPHHANWIDPVDAYKELWESINGKGFWAVNPWVWVVSFTKVQEA